jgi:hypothetical protein
MDELKSIKEIGFQPDKESIGCCPGHDAAYFLYVAEIDPALAVKNHLYCGGDIHIIFA